jgi:hypothetical protein
MRIVLVSKSHIKHGMKGAIMAVRMRRRSTVAGLVAGLVGAGSAVPALAHMPYVAPGLFDVGQRAKVVVEAAFTEDAFRPDIVMTDAPFEVTGPDGATRRLADPIRFTYRAVTEAELPVEGVYRLSSGQRLGRMNKMVRDGAAWKVLEEKAAVPQGAEVLQVQSTTLADAYVVRGKPGATGALAPRGKALEIHPIGDPTAVGAGEPFALEILFDGKRLAGAAVSIFREAGYYDGRKVAGEIKAGPDGKISVTAPDAGRYLLLVRHRAAAPAGAAAPYYSYTVTLSFEAT